MGNAVTSSLSETQIRGAHERYDKTRCAAWLLATGYRPVGGVSDITLAKGPVEVVLAAEPLPEFGCDVHKVED